MAAQKPIKSATFDGFVVSLELMLADELGFSQATKGKVAREVLDRRRVHRVQHVGETTGLYLCGCDGMAWVHLDRAELAVLADYAADIDHPDAEMLAGLAVSEGT